MSVNNIGKASSGTEGQTASSPSGYSVAPPAAPADLTQYLAYLSNLAFLSYTEFLSSLSAQTTAGSGCGSGCSCDSKCGCDCS